jgi:methylase of polypeptide subunit release factors
MAAFNAHFNRKGNVEFHQGDLFEPVSGQTFDLILCNPPFVISPDLRTRYRDSGLPSDGISSSLVRTAPRFLRPGGFAQILINWAHVKGQDWRERLHSWLEGSGCDAWVLRFETTEPDKYAAVWLSPQDGLEAYTRSFEQWMAYYESEQIEAIGYGSMILRRRTSGPTWFAHDDLPKASEACGEAVLRGFALRDFLAANPEDQTLLANRFRLNPLAEVEQRLHPGASGWQMTPGCVHLTGGLTFALQVDNLGMSLLGCIRGDKPLGMVLTELAGRLNHDPARLSAAAMPFVRCLIEQGFLLPVQS